ncbi:hypothetical protein ACP70R_000691 [Stipagrostis hirtigluma subsp. patula]
MEQEMLNLYPDGIRVLIVDDDPKFLKSASMMLSLLNFKVATCGSPISALRMLAGEKLKGVHVVLTSAEKAAACGFDFKAIVEPDLRIPVVYFISLDHQCAGDEADELLRTLQAATFIIKKPLDADELCSLWRVIAWRKCVLDCRRFVLRGIGGGSSSRSTISTVDGEQCGGGGSGSAQQPLLVSDDEDEEEERVHFKVVKGLRKGRKRRAGKPGGSSSGSGLSSNPGSVDHPTKTAEQMNAKGLEKDRAASHPQPAPQKYGAKKAKNGGGDEASKSQQPQALDVAAPTSQPAPPPESRFVQSVLQKINVPPYNPKIFADAAGPSSINVSAFAGAGAGSSNTSAAPAPPLVYQQQRQQQKLAGDVFSVSNIAAFVASTKAASRAPASAWPPVHQQQQTVGNVFSNIAVFPTGNAVAPAPAPALPSPVYQQQQCAGNVLGNNASFVAGNNLAPAPAPAPASAPPPAYQQQRPAGNVFSNITAFAGGGASAAAHQQQPAAGNVFGDVAPPAATATLETVAIDELSLDNQQLMFGPFPYQGPTPPAMQRDTSALLRSGMPRRETANTQLPFQQPAAGGDLYMTMTGGATIGASSAAATQHAGMFGDSTAGYLSPSLNLGAADHGDELAAMVAMYTMADPAPAATRGVGVAADEAAMQPFFVGDGAGSLAAPQVLGLAPNNVNDPAMAGGLESLGAAANGNQLAVGAPGNINGTLVGSGAAADGVTNFAAMVASDDNENVSFPLEELLGLGAPMYDAGLGGATDGGAAANAAGTSLNGGEGGTRNWDMGASDGLGTLDDIFNDSTDPFLLLNYMNNGDA